jgi:hypothetical protein
MYGEWIPRVKGKTILDVGRARKRAVIYAYSNFGERCIVTTPEDRCGIKHMYDLGGFKREIREHQPEPDAPRPQVYDGQFPWSGMPADFTQPEDGPPCPAWDDVPWGLKQVTASKLELEHADGLCTSNNILKIADSLIAYYTNAEADLAAHYPIALWDVAPPRPVIDANNFEVEIDKSGVWNGPLFDNHGEWISPPFLVRLPAPYLYEVVNRFPTK